MAKVTIKGVDEARTVLRKLARDAPAKVLAPAVKAGLDVLRHAVLQRVPVLSGALKATVQIQIKPPRQGKVSGVVTVGDAAHPYAASDEYGNYHQHGQRFLSHAWDAAHTAAQRAVDDRVKAGLDRLT